MAADLERVGYSPSSRRTFLVYARQFAAYHKRSPRNLGREQVLCYLRHLVEDKNVALVTYRNARTALCFLYEITLKRPEVVEQLPLAPKDLVDVAV